MFSNQLRPLLAGFPEVDPQTVATKYWKRGSHFLESWPVKDNSASTVPWPIMKSRLWGTHSGQLANIWTAAAVQEPTAAASHCHRHRAPNRQQQHHIVTGIVPQINSSSITLSQA